MLLQLEATAKMYEDLTALMSIILSDLGFLAQGNAEPDGIDVKQSSAGTRERISVMQTDQVSRVLCHQCFMFAEYA